MVARRLAAKVEIIKKCKKQERAGMLEYDQESATVVAKTNAFDKTNLLPVAFGEMEHTPEFQT